MLLRVGLRFRTVRANSESTESSGLVDRRFAAVDIRFGFPRSRPKNLSIERSFMHVATARFYLLGQRLAVLLVIAAGVGAVLQERWSNAAEASQKPNLVFIMADDLGWADLAFHKGNAPTPNLDKLAREGVELTQHYVAPVCSPTRTGLMTGRFWSRFNVTTPQNERALPWKTVTLPRALKTVGYDTCITGKWHLGSKTEWGPNHFGFDHSYGSLAGGVGPWNHAYKQGEFSPAVTASPTSSCSKNLAM